VALTLAGWPFRPDLLEQGLDRFRNQNPGVSVSFTEVLNDYRQRLDEWMTSENPPNVVQVREGQAAAWARAGMIRPLGDMPTFVDLSGRLRPAAREAVAPGGEVFGLPFYSDVMVLAFNREMLDQVGDRPPQTWEELGAFAKELRALGVSETPISLNFAPKVNANLPWWAMLYAAGGTLLAGGVTDADPQEPAARLLHLLRRFLAEDLTLDPGLGEATYSGLDGSVSAFTLVGTYAARQFAENRKRNGGPPIELAPVPGLDGPGAATVSWTPFYAVTSSAPDLEESILLALHLGGIDAGGEFFSATWWAREAGLPPAYPEVLASPDVSQAVSSWVDPAFLDSVLSMGLPVEAMWEPWFESWEQWSQDEIMRAIWATATPEEALGAIRSSAHDLRTRMGQGSS